MTKSILKRIFRVLAFALVGLLIAHMVLSEKKIYWQDMSFASMSTFVKFRFYVRDTNALAPAANLVQSAFREVNMRCNRFDPESELAKLNSTAYKEPFRCSDELWGLLNDARRMYLLSNGAFDVTIEPLMKLWGFHRKEKKLPTAEAIAEAKKKVGMDKIIFDDQAKTVRFTVEGMSIDLGGIAKGAALDLAAEKLRDKTAVGTELSGDVSWMKYLEARFNNRLSPLNRGFVDVGGNVIALDEAPPKQEAYIAAVRNPVAPRSLNHCATAKILGESISTSGNYERYVTIDGKQYAHIVDPATGMPVSGVLSVTVITKRAVDADALSTAFFVRGRDTAFYQAMKKEFPDLRLLMYYRDPASPEKISFWSEGDWLEITVPAEETK